MPVIIQRDVWEDNNGARWALFAIFIVIILVIIGGTLRANKKRSSNGLQPIYGTRWMTPPSYGVSQSQHNRSTGDDPATTNNYVPTYTATANEQDMGFYDNNGEFHANPNAKPAYTVTDELEMPPQTHIRSHSNDGVAIHELDDLRRPSYPVNSNDINANPNNENRDDLSSTEYEPPLGPPPPSDVSEVTDRNNHV